jgi:hypothetical protein
MTEQEDLVAEEAEEFNLQYPPLLKITYWRVLASENRSP